MANKKDTRIKYELPRGDWTIVVRLADYACTPYQRAHADFLRDILGLGQNETDVDEDGNLFAALKTVGLENEEVLHDSAVKLYRGIARLALDPQILAMTISTDQLSPELRLSESFPYLDQDVSLEMYNEVMNLHYTAVDDRDVFAELDQMLDA